MLSPSITCPVVMLIIFYKDNSLFANEIFVSKFIYPSPVVCVLIQFNISTKCSFCWVNFPLRINTFDFNKISVF